jgi:hypothetical protein
MANLPSDVASQVIDAIGLNFVLGDISDGDRESQVLLRAYLQCLQQLLRSANWAFARRSTPLVMLADATGQTPNVGTVVLDGYLYEYAYPTDCMKLRYIPWQYQNQSVPIPPGNTQLPNQPLYSNMGVPALNNRIRPARWVLSQDSNYAPPPGQLTWETQGMSPTGRTVILTNVNCAHAVYTGLILYPSQWDSLFREALVAYMASQVALALTTDKKLGLAIRNEQIQIAKMKIEQARLVDGDEGVYSSDINVDWMQKRRAGYGGYYDGYGYGGIDQGYGGFGGWDSCSFADGSAY